MRGRHHKRKWKSDVISETDGYQNNLLQHTQAQNENDQNNKAGTGVQTAGAAEDTDSEVKPYVDHGDDET